MAFADLMVTEIFHSLQGETSLTGVRFAFIRLTGCNLRCTYCDSTYAFKGGRRMRISEIIEAIAEYKVEHVLVTGGEPLMQRPTPVLVRELAAAGYKVSIETHGETSIADVSDVARIVMDVKTPSSGMCRGGYEKNLKWLKPSDEVKFVIASPQDYEFAKGVVTSGVLPTREVLFSSAIPNAAAPGTFPGVTSGWLASRILEDRLPVRLQVQLHKVLWGDQRGV